MPPDRGHKTANVCLECKGPLTHADSILISQPGQRKLLLHKKRCYARWRQRANKTRRIEALKERRKEIIAAQVEEPATKASEVLPMLKPSNGNNQQILEVQPAFAAPESPKEKLLQLTLPRFVQSKRSCGTKFGEQVRAYREKNRLSGRDFGIMCGCKPSYAASWCSRAEKNREILVNAAVQKAFQVLGFSMETGLALTQQRANEPTNLMEKPVETRPTPTVDNVVDLLVNFLAAILRGEIKLGEDVPQSILDLIVRLRRDYHK